METLIGMAAQTRKNGTRLAFSALDRAVGWKPLPKDELLKSRLRTALVQASFGNEGSAMYLLQAYRGTPVQDDPELEKMIRTGHLIVMELTK